MSRSPVFSVIIPTFNRRDKLLRSVESVKRSTFGDYELIVVDDGSTDGTEEAIRRLHPDLIYIYQDNSGVASARNHGVAVSSGTHIAFLDADDIWHPEKLQICQAVFDAIPKEVCIVFNDIRQLRGAGSPKASAAEQCFGKNVLRVLRSMRGATDIRVRGVSYRIRHGCIFDSLLMGNVISPSCAVLKREVFDKIPGFNPEYRVANDSDFFLRASNYFQVGFIPAILTSYEGADHVLSLSRPSHNLEKIENTIRTISSLLEQETSVAVRRRLKQRMSDLYFRKAYHFLSELQKERARQCCLKAITTYPTLLSNVALLFMTLIPDNALLTVQALKRVLRHLGGDSSSDQT